MAPNFYYSNSFERKIFTSSNLTRGVRDVNGTVILFTNVAMIRERLQIVTAELSFRMNGAGHKG